MAVVKDLDEDDGLKVECCEPCVVDEVTVLSQAVVKVAHAVERSVATEHSEVNEPKGIG